jgi:hypothetical protein
VLVVGGGDSKDPHSDVSVEEPSAERANTAMTGSMRSGVEGSVKVRFETRVVDRSATRRQAALGHASAGAQSPGRD